LAVKVHVGDGQGSLIYFDQALLGAPDALKPTLQ
jgi:hypothetical protein